jgi:hypothetical protein
LQALAERLDLPLEEWLELFGLGWVEQDDEPWHDYDADPSGGLGFPATPWHTKGDPMQLMVQVFPHGVFIARPEGSWGGDHRLTFHASVDQEYVARDELHEKAPELIARLLTARRRRFRWCPGCWRHTPPERMTSPTCMGCFDSAF